MSGPSPTWQTDAAVTGSIQWSLPSQTTPGNLSYLQKYGNADVDGDGFTDMIVSNVAYLPANDDTDADTAVLFPSVILSRLEGPSYTSVVPWAYIPNTNPQGLFGVSNDGYGGGYSPADLLSANADANACIGQSSGGTFHAPDVFAAPACGSTGTSDNPGFNPVSSPNTLADMNGDGIPDWILMTCSTIAVAYGRGDGWFGHCSDGTQNCSCTGMTADSYTLPSNLSLAFAHVHDVDGDGLADLIVPSDTGFTYYTNVGGGFSQSGVDVNVLSSFGWTHAFTPPGATNYTFADMDGSGVDDVVMVNSAAGQASPSDAPASIGYVAVNGPARGAAAGLRPGLLSLIFDPNANVTTSIQYATITQAGATSQPLFVVSQMGVSQNTSTLTLSPDATTTYAYAGATYDTRDRQFIGFQSVDAYTSGDSVSDPPMHTATQFYQGYCTAGSATNPCPTTADYANHALRGLPVVSAFDNATVQSAASATLSTTHHGYTALTTYNGLDGRNVRRVWESQTDEYLYDTSNPSPPTVPTSMTDVTVDGQALTSQSSFSTAANAVHTMQLRTVDPWGLDRSTDDYGLVDGSGNAVQGIIRNVATYAPAKQDTVDYWIWRPYDKYTTGAISSGVSPPTPGSAQSTGVKREFTYDYDSRGNMLHVYSPLSGTLPVSRWHQTDGAPVAGQPPVYSSNGAVTLTQITYTSDGTGDVKRVEQPGTSGCVDLGYDSLYGDVVTTTKKYLQGCDTNYVSTVVAQYERGLGVATDTTAADGERTVRTLDQYGRPLALQLPDQVVPGWIESPPTITFDYRDTEAPRKVHTSVVDGSATREYWQYLDGFGRPLLSVSPGDPANGDSSSWIVSGGVQRSAKGNVLSAVVAGFYTSGTDPDAVPLPVTGLSRTFKYDAFGRPIAAADIDGTIVYQRTYQQLGSVVKDAEQLLSPGPAATHSGYSTTITLDSHGRVSTMTQTGATQLNESYAYQPTGELASLQRLGLDANGNQYTYQRWMQYDSLGRMVLNAEPNSTLNFAPPPAPANMKAWTYAYDDAGHLVGTVDARGCGENFAYDGAGRLVSEDYSPCLNVQLPYTQGPEVQRVYDDAGVTGALVLGRLTDVRDRASHVQYGYDGRSRLTSAERWIADPIASTAVSYSNVGYTKTMKYDDWDRLTQESTGANVVDLQSFGIGLPGGPTYSAGVIAATYSPRGVPTYITGAYGDLVTGVQLEADGRPDSIQYADNAGTTISYKYNDPRQRLTETTVSRPLGFASPDAEAAFTAQTVLAHDVLGTAASGGYNTNAYDAVSNPTLVTDNRIAGEWPPSAQPVPPRSFTYDDAYRLTKVSSATPTPGSYSAPMAQPNASTSPLPMSNVTSRVQTQTFSYNGLGDSITSTDDQDDFFDRSLGAISNGGTSTAPGPNQLATAAIAHSKSGNPGNLSTTYDAAGNLVQLALIRGGTCTPAAGCSQLFQYDWDEVGNLARGRRYDLDATEPANYPYPNVPASSPEADVAYTYDGGGHRVIRGPGDPSAGEKYSVEVFGSLRLNDATWDGAYEDTVDTEGVYLTFGGMSLGRVVGDLPPELSPSSDTTHVFLEISDSLGSTSSVVDVESGELVERTTYQAYGAVESDYRPDRWKNFREDYKFSGKEEDVELGVTYFGARYYSAYLGRWISPDPLTIHGLGGDVNPYAYVHGRVTTATDPFGYEEEDDAGPPDAQATETATQDGDPNTSGNQAVAKDPTTDWGPDDVCACCNGCHGHAQVVPATDPAPSSPTLTSGGNGGGGNGNAKLKLALEIVRLTTRTMVAMQPGGRRTLQSWDYYQEHPERWWPGYMDKAEKLELALSVLSMVTEGTPLGPAPPMFSPVGGGPAFSPMPLAVPLELDPPALLASKANTGNSATDPPKPSAEPNFVDPSKAPEPSADWQWKGRGAPGTQGNWVNVQTGEKFNPDLNHPPPIGPHYDYVDLVGKEWRLFSDGRMSPK
jgi:RHS repeat-associated protein